VGNQADRRFRWLLWLSLTEIGTMMVFANYSALLPVLQKEWFLTHSQAGWIYSSYQIGSIHSVVFLSSLTDYTSPKYIYIITAFWTGVSGIFFSLRGDPGSHEPRRCLELSWLFPKLGMGLRHARRRGVGGPLDHGAAEEANFLIRFLSSSLITGGVYPGQVSY
jgi:MFS family permease